MDLDQLLLKLKCRDLEEYQNVFAAQQSGSSSAQKGYSGTIIIHINRTNKPVYK